MKESDEDTIRQSFNQTFCELLEFSLTRAFAEGNDKSLRGFWCDGVAMPFSEHQLGKKVIAETKMIISKAWLGFDGQTEYEMTIHLGATAMACIVHGSDLQSCLPESDWVDWVTLDKENRTVAIRLN